MGWKDWFKRKAAPKDEGVSQGGSRLIRYPKQKNKPEMGFLEQSTLEFTEQREKVYVEMFGENDTVLHELVPFVPHVDVYRFPPNDKRDFFTYVTGGMSDLPMNSPEELGPGYRRAEIVFYAKESRDEYPELLRTMAHFPHDNNSWLHYWHTFPNGQPPEPLFESPTLDTMFFMPSILSPDSTLEERLVLDSDPVSLLWLVPITTAECELKLEQGTEALLDLFQEQQHPFLFDVDRRSYV
ncbi:suppressor of fused domain protein [Bremerella sp.]|uniref:suppressor of fused domain protein n=1 Tax=Bremerella sp. TaxID=2795602 RepID=UPI003919962D